MTNWTGDYNWKYHKGIFGIFRNCWVPQQKCWVPQQKCWVPQVIPTYERIKIDRDKNKYQESDQISLGFCSFGQSQVSQQLHNLMIRLT